MIPANDDDYHLLVYIRQSYIQCNNMVSIELIKQLREETDISLAECKKVLEESNGDIEKQKKY